MKKKITLIALMLVLVTSLMVLFAFSVSAEGEIEVKYINNNGTTKEVINPNADGTYTLKATGFSKNGKFTFKDGTVVNKEFFGWFDLEGNIYAPGETVAFTKNTQIKEAYGVVVNNLTEFIEIMDQQQDYTFIRLNTDIETTSTIGSGWDTTMIDLNGHTLTIKQSNDKKYAVGISRGSFMLVGKGKVVHNHEKLNTTDNNYSFCQFTYSGYASDSNPQFFVVGKDVEIVTPYYLVRIDQAIVGGPKMYVSGKVSAKGIIRTAAQLNSAIIEITESVFIENFELINSNIEKLANAGIKFYLDDFGTGYSNLTTVIALPFSTVKMDRSLVLTMEESNRNYKLVKNLISTFKDANLEVLVEGVETQEQNYLVKNAGADYVQGYLYSKPLSEIV